MFNFGNECTPSGFYAAPSIVHARLEKLFVAVARFHLVFALTSKTDGVKATVIKETPP